MQEWEKKFDSVALLKGKGLYHGGKVTDLTKTQEHISAAVSEVRRYEVDITLKEGMPARMKCMCPKARGGNKCGHMAAALYAVYGDLGASETAREREEQARTAAREAAFIAAELETARRADEEKTAELEAAKKKEMLAKQITERENEKKAKREERKRKRMEAELAVKQTAREQERREAEAEKHRQEQAALRAAEQAREKAAAEALRKAEEEAAERKKMEKIQEAISRKEKEEKDKDKDKDKDKEKDRDKENYQYFEFPEILSSIEVAGEDLKKGQKLCEAGKVSLENVQTGYIDDYDSLVVEAVGKGKDKNSEFDIHIIFSKDEVLRTICNCPQCRRDYYRGYFDLNNCAYTAGLLLKARRYLMEKHIGDATDKSGVGILTSYQQQHANQLRAETMSQDESLHLAPKLTGQGDKLTLTFRVGADKLFVIKNLFEFCDHVQDSETAVYGSNTKINHRLDNFDQKGRKWFGYLNRVMQEEAQLEMRMEQTARYYYQSSWKCSAIEMYGWRLDQLFTLLAEDQIDYEEKADGKKTKGTLRCKEVNPRIQLQIRKCSSRDKKTFLGVEVSCKIPQFFQGVKETYYIDGGYLCKAEYNFAKRIMPLSGQAVNGRVEFRIGRKNLSEFYYSLLPQLSGVVDITEENSEEIHAYLPPEVQFVFYLDTQEHNITCRVHALYGEEEVSVLDILGKESRAQMGVYRMPNREEDIFYLTYQLFPEIDIEKDEMHCGGDEEVMYQVLERGVETLAELGEVKCTKRFRDMNVIRKVKASVGVSVSGGLLNLEIMTEDISREELLDVLRSYRSRKKFYRLKNGDFLNLDDNILQMLGELKETMHLTDKEFLKGKMQLPAFRTLYLDKMLEQNENIYSTRDSHFRNLVKSFKTVNDADYEEPQSLAHIMRSYQKNGYKWLRTLENCQFGGILADDMGLGKTLQMIAVLLAAKEEGEEGTSLVICPASLIFNWGEEFYRFAPLLKILLITGSQEERQGKLESYAEYDVLVTSYDLLKRDIAFYEGKQFLYEVIDEAQYIKNHTTAAAKAVKVIRAKVRFAMTGTPVENRLSELWSIFDYLMPGFLYGYEAFKKELEIPIVKNGDGDAMKRLQRMVGPFILRRLKGDVLKDLPDKLEEVRYVQFDAMQRKIYDAQVVHMQERIASQDGDEFNKNKIQILAELTKLRQICCDPSLGFENYKGESAKLESCLELIQSAIDGGHKLLVFSQFTTMLEIIQKRLDGLGIGYYKITGATTKEKRLQQVKEFNLDETPVFLISLKAGGVGLNLTGADVVIHYDPWWNLAVQNQATDRAHRIGQTKKVTVYKLIARNSVEEKIQELQETKKDLADQIMDTQTGQLGSMNREELLELLGV